ncbi:sulfur carrier protein ThiS adenylyltransferase ThiF [bacterium]|nr:MAG: sulfur carrier protein ThiS adenylyltransferase ThiF [bacterium]
MIDKFRSNLIKKLGVNDLKKAETARVGLAGAGGLGSNCAANLVRTGFKKLTIVDFDIIDPSNLDRQFYFKDQVGMRKVDALKINLLRINPGLELKVINKKINSKNAKELFRDCDIVVECFDRAEYKSMLIGELIGAGKFIVSASGLGGIGSSDRIKVHRVKNNLTIVGDLKSDISMLPALSPRVNVAAAKQADVVLEFVLNKHE